MTAKTYNNIHSQIQSLRKCCIVLGLWTWVDMTRTWPSRKNLIRIRPKTNSRPNLEKKSVFDLISISKTIYFIYYRNQGRMADPERVEQIPDPNFKKKPRSETATLLISSHRLFRKAMVLFIDEIWMCPKVPTPRTKNMVHAVYSSTKNTGVILI